MSDYNEMSEQAKRLGILEGPDPNTGKFKAVLICLALAALAFYAWYRS